MNRVVSREISGYLLQLHSFNEIVIKRQKQKAAEKCTMVKKFQSLQKFPPEAIKWSFSLF